MNRLEARSRSQAGPENVSVDGDRRCATRGGARVMKQHHTHDDDNDYDGKDDESLRLHDGLREPAPSASSHVPTVLQTS